MSALDLSSKVLIGFGWPKLAGQDDAGDVFTYLDDLVSYGQWDDSSDSCVSGEHGVITYSFDLTKNTGSGLLRKIIKEIGIPVKEFNEV